MVIVRTKILPPGAGAFTAYPFIFINPRYSVRSTMLEHERVHYEQQRRWALYGLGVGLLAWFLLYLFFLPVWKNPFRDRWEREAYHKAQGYSDEVIDAILVRRPYYLWSLRKGKSPWAV